jgi:hypothetical protein
VLEALELSSASLWNWRRTRSRLRQRTRSRAKAARRRPKKFQFIEVKAEGAVTSLGELQVELDLGDGKRMRVEGLSMPQVRELAEGFLPARGSEQ